MDVCTIYPLVRQGVLGLDEVIHRRLPFLLPFLEVSVQLQFAFLRHLPHHPSKDKRAAHRRKHGGHKPPIVKICTRDKDMGIGGAPQDRPRNWRGGGGHAADANTLSHTGGAQNNRQRSQGTAPALLRQSELKVMAHQGSCYNRRKQKTIKNDILGQNAELIYTALFLTRFLLCRDFGSYPHARTLSYLYEPLQLLLSAGQLLHGCLHLPPQQRNNG